MTTMMACTGAVGATVFQLAAPAVATPAQQTAPAPQMSAVPTRAATVDGTPCTATANACVDLSAQKAWLIKNGHVIYGAVPITSGAVDAPTPAGTFHVEWKDIDHYSSEFDHAPMPYSVFFDKHGDAFHEGSLRDESAGCIHLSNSAAKTFFETLQVGNEVQIVP